MNLFGPSSSDYLTPPLVIHPPPPASLSTKTETRTKRAKHPTCLNAFLNDQQSCPTATEAEADVSKLSHSCVSSACLPHISLCPRALGNGYSASAVSHFLHNDISLSLFLHHTAAIPIPCSGSYDLHYQGQQGRGQVDNEMGRGH